MGFHSVPALARDDAETRERKIRLFWTIYVHEKGLSRRLGRSSTIRDSEITIPRPRLDGSDTINCGWMPKWIELARLQGMVYDQIYSPSILRLPQAAPIARARRLASDLEALVMNVTPEEVWHYACQAEMDSLHPDLYFRADTV